MRDALDLVAEHWIGYTVPPAAGAVASTAWRSEAGDRACPRCGSTVGAGEVVAGACVSCVGTAVCVDAVIRLGTHQGELRRWILEIKFRHRWWEMAEALGRELAVVVAANPLYDAARAIIVPMPMPDVRRRSRGIDHAHAIAIGVSAALGRPLGKVLRHRGGAAQTRRTSRDRRRGPTIIATREQGALAGRQVILVDDVLTTGATIRSAARALENLGPTTILAAVLAVRDEPRRRPGGPSHGAESAKARISPI